MISVWLLHYPSVTAPALLDRYHVLLDTNERAAVDAMPRHRRRHQLITRAAVRCCLSRFHPQVRPAQWALSRDVNGKPVLDPQHPPLHFNISHTSDWLAVAIGRHPQLGIDLEQARKRRRITQIATAYFTPCEAEQLAALPADKQQQRFLTLWTLKEAFLKATGSGLAGGLDQVRFDTLNRPTFRDPHRQQEPWQFVHSQLNNNVHLGLACTSMTQREEPLFYLTVPLESEIPLPSEAGRLALPPHIKAKA